MAVKWRKIGSIEPMTCKWKRGILISSQIGSGRKRCRFGSDMLLERHFLLPKKIKGGTFVWLNN